MPATDPNEQEARQARRVLWWVLGAVIVFNLGLLSYIFLPRH